VNKPKIILFIVLFQVFMFAIQATDKKPVAKPVAAKKIGIVFFEGTFKEALTKAKLEKKMVFIDCYTSWCRPCKQLTRDIFPNEQLGKYMNENFVCMTINSEKGEGRYIKRKYPHYTFPTLLYIKNNGVLKNRFVGLPSYGANELLNFAKLVTNNYN
jgi:thioredoxin 1